MRQVNNLVFTLIWLLVGAIFGIAGGLFYAWRIDPRVETGVRPAQIAESDKQRILIALSVAYGKDRDLLRAASRLNEVGRTWQDIADLACNLSQTNYISTTAGLTAVRSMVELAGLQGATSCASAQLPIFTDTPRPSPTFITMTPTRVPAATKTPTPTLGPTFTPRIRITETPEPTGAFQIQGPDAVCDPRSPGTILILVRDSEDKGIPGMPIEVITLTTRERFFTGLMPERDPGLADYVMTPGETYQVQLPDLSNRTRRFEATECTADGQTTRTSYRITFRRIANR